MKKQNILIVGVGGQGVVLASNILSDAALADGYDAKKTDTLGMAQRGGSVVSHMRFSEKVYSPLIRRGEADIIIGFEKLEAVRWGHFLKPGGLLIINNMELPPLSISMGAAAYPSDAEIIGIARQYTDNICLIDGSHCATEMGNSRLLNTIMLGYASSSLPLDAETLRKTIASHLPAKLQKINDEAFSKGLSETPLDISDFKRLPKNHAEL